MIGKKLPTSTFKKVYKCKCLNRTEQSLFIFVHRWLYSFADVVVCSHTTVWMKHLVKNMNNLDHSRATQKIVIIYVLCFKSEYEVRAGLFAILIPLSLIHI